MVYTVADIARVVGGAVTGDPSIAIRGLNSLELAGPSDLSFVSSPTHFREGERSLAGCVIAPGGFTPAGKTIITVERPKITFVKVMWLFNPDYHVGTGVHATAVIDPSASIGADVSIGPLVTIGPRAHIGDRATLGPGVVVGEGVRIGDGTRIAANVTLYHGVVIGSRVTIHSGTVIGADGFGFVLDAGKQVKVPQLGTVIIGDDVEIGANCTIDRATFGSTVIGRGTKTDNLVHIAHNVTIGEHSLIVAQVGIAGSSKIGSYVTLAGQVGVGDNAVIGDSVTVAGQSGVASGQRIESHQTVWGLPAKPIEDTKREAILIKQLPKLQQRLIELQARVEALEDAAKIPS